jgi:hypothetical protein
MSACRPTAWLKEVYPGDNSGCSSVVALTRVGLIDRVWLANSLWGFRAPRPARRDVGLGSATPQPADEIQSCGLQCGPASTGSVLQAQEASRSGYFTTGVGRCGERTGTTILSLRDPAAGRRSTLRGAREQPCFGQSSRRDARSEGTEQRHRQSDLSPGNLLLDRPTAFSSSLNLRPWPEGG